MIERHEDGRPREWDWVLVCAAGNAAGTWMWCSGPLARSSDTVGAELRCANHRHGMVNGTEATRAKMVMTAVGREARTIAMESVP